jgi:hypothetical protein
MSIRLARKLCKFELQINKVKKNNIKKIARIHKHYATCKVLPPKPNCLARRTNSPILSINAGGGEYELTSYSIIAA